MPEILPAVLAGRNDVNHCGRLFATAFMLKGFEWYKHLAIPHDEPPPPPPPSPEELEAQREMDDLTDANFMSYKDDGE